MRVCLHICKTLINILSGLVKIRVGIYVALLTKNELLNFRGFFHSGFFRPNH